MRERLFEEIQWQNKRLQRVSLDLKRVGYYLTPEFFYLGLGVHATEQEMIEYLVEKSIFYEEQYASMQQSEIGNLELFELLGEAAPEEILSRVYKKRWVHDWMELIKDAEQTVENFICYLQMAEEE